MRRYDRRQTYLSFARRVAKEHGLSLDKETLNGVIWENTGFPCFFMGNHLEEFDRQLTEFFREAAAT